MSKLKVSTAAPRLSTRRRREADMSDAGVPPGPADWRVGLLPNCRLRIISKIVETLKRRLPYSGTEGLMELGRIAARFEGRVYAAATSRSDYLRKICLKMITMETDDRQISQNPMVNSFPSASAASDTNNP